MLATHQMQHPLAQRAAARRSSAVTRRRWPCGLDSLRFLGNQRRLPLPA